MDARATLRDVAADHETELTGVPAYPDWRHEAERLMAAGEAILSGKETYGAHLDRLVTARTHMTRALSALREVIGLMTRNWPNGRRVSCDACETATGSAPGSHRMTATRRTVREPYLPAPSPRGWRSPASAAAIGYLVGGQDYHDRRRTETFAREALERSQVLKRDWNRQVDRAAEEGVHVIYTDGFNRLHEELDSLSQNMLLDRGVKSEISAVLKQLGKAVSNRKYFDNWPKLMAGQMDRRETLVASAAERGVAVPDHEDYDTWRNVTDFCGGPLRGTLGQSGEIRHPPRFHRACAREPRLSARAGAGRA